MARLIRKVMRMFFFPMWPHYDYQRQQIRQLELQSALLERQIALQERQVALVEELTQPQVDHQGQQIRLLERQIALLEELTQPQDGSTHVS